MDGRRLTRSALTGLGLAAGTVLVRRWLSPRDSFRGQVVVISGGSRGLGLEMARLFAAEGAYVAICARTSHQVDQAVAELQRSNAAGVMGVVCDVTHRGEATRFIDDVITRWGRVDVLINNAGIIQVGPVECMTRDDFEHAMATHLWGPMNLTDAVLPGMKRRRRGRIVNISSIGAHIAVPHLLPYATSKFALRGWSEGLAAEVCKEGIKVTTVSPGLMRTGSPRNASFKGQHRSEYAMFSVGAAVPVLAIHSQVAARRIVEGCRAGAAVVMVSAMSLISSTVHAAFRGLTIPLLGLIAEVLPSAAGGTRQNIPGHDSESAWSPSWITTLNERAAVRNNEL